MEKPNLSYINKLSKGDKEFEYKILNIVNEELKHEIDSYYAFLKDKNINKTKIYIHRIKHKMSILGLEKSYLITNDYENEIINGTYKNQSYFENMLPIMINYLKTLNL